MTVRVSAKALFLFALAAFLFLSLHNAALARRAREAQAYAPVIGSQVRVEGVVTGEIDAPNDEPKARIGEVVADGHALPGFVRATFPFGAQVLPGDRVRGTCRLDAPGVTRDGFDYGAYLARSRTYATCGFSAVETTDSAATIGRVLAWTRQALSARLADLVPAPHGAFLAGLLFGGSHGIPAGLEEAFRATGTSHILAASGYNVSLFALLLLGPLMEALGRRRGAFAAALLVVAYVLLAGAGSAVMRAGVMALLVLLARGVRRAPSAPRLLALAAGGMLAWNPLLIADAGFQLSVAATGAILAFADRAADRLSFLPEAYGIRESAGASAVAYLATVSIVFWHFESISLISPLTNLLVLPLVPFAMAASGAALLASALGIVIGRVMAFPAWAFSNVILHVIAWEGRLPFASVAPEVSRVAVASVGLIILLLVFVWRRRTRA